jgi:excisionase family DNA binding protein
MCASWVLGAAEKMKETQMNLLDNRQQENGNAVKHKLMFNKSEVAEMLSISVRTIENLMTNGELAFRKIGRRVLIPWKAVVQFTRADHATGGQQ